MISLFMNLLIVFSTNRFIYKMSENGECLKLAQPKVTSTDVLFCPTNSTKAKHIQFSVLPNKSKQQIPTFETLQPKLLLKIIIIIISLVTKRHFLLIS